MTEIPSCTLSQYLWYNTNIQIDKTSIHFSWFSTTKKKTMFHNFLIIMAPLKKWLKFRREYNLHQNSYFQWVQLIDSIPEKWKFIKKNQ